MSPRSLLLALVSAPLLAFAQSANPFSIPDAGLSATGGQPLELMWNPTTDGTVTLVLRSGNADNLAEGTVIASNIDNSGSYTWTPSDSLTRGSDYTIEIVDDDDVSNTNFTPYFVLDTTTTVAQSTSQVTLGAPTETPDKSSASPTGAATSVLDATMDTSSAAATTMSSMSADSSSAPASSSMASSSPTSMDAAATTSAPAGKMTMSAGNMTMGAGAPSAGSSTNSSASPSSSVEPFIGGAASLKVSAALGAFGLVALCAMVL